MRILITPIGMGAFEPMPQAGSATGFVSFEFVQEPASASSSFNRSGNDLTLDDLIPGFSRPLTPDEKQERSQTSRIRLGDPGLRFSRWQLPPALHKLFEDLGVEKKQDWIVNTEVWEELEAARRAYQELARWAQVPESQILGQSLDDLKPLRRTLTTRFHPDSRFPNATPNLTSFKAIVGTWTVIDDFWKKYRTP